MKKYIILSLCLGLYVVSMTSCLEEYLDKAPEAGLAKEDVFTKYENFIKYFNTVYDGYTIKFTDQGGGANDNYNIRAAYPLFCPYVTTYSWEGLTPMCDQGYLAASSHYIKSGIFSQNRIQSFTYFSKPILASMFILIRTANTTMKNISLLTDGTQENIDDLIAQAYFARAFAHFELVRWFGGMPYITKVIGSDDQWDIPRLSPHETLVKAAADFDTAVIYYEKANRMRRDPGPGQVGHLNSPDQFRPNGVAAKAYKARALLYAASPLNNELGVKDWEEAAKANWEAIQIAEQYGYAFLSAADYKKNFVGSSYTNEQIFSWYIGNLSYTSFGSLVPGIFTNAPSNSGQAPSQNFIDMFETKWGDPLLTPSERDASTTAGHYNEQDPYKNRDPRFYIDIIYNQAPLLGFGQADIYYQMVNGSPVYGYHLNQTYSGITNTGYYDRKHWGDQSIKNPVTTQYTDPLMRLAELYLNYAEAANEAYGPNTAAPGATMTAVQAINKIRGRWTASEIAPVQVQFTTTTEVFRPRIKNERNIELCLEGHYFHDIRRWKDAPDIYSTPIMGVEIEKVPVSATYPSGFKYTRRPIPAVRQSAWTKDAMYYVPFTTVDNYKMKSFKPNPLW
jgi:tetratricopeptide (TPR) repeat protein